MRILFFTDNFPPEVNAPATRTYEHCIEWVKAGAEVTVITCAPNFPRGKVYAGYRNKLLQREKMEGIKVVRIWTYISANKGFFKRSLDYLSYGFGAFWISLFLRCDLIIATSPQFFTAVGAGMAAAFKGRPWIMEVRDLWPESIRSVNAMKQGTLIKWLEKLELSMYRKAKRIVVVTESFKENIAGRGISRDKIHIIKNGVNFEHFTPRPKDLTLIKQLHLENKFVIGYIGTHGMAHKLDFIIHCAEQLQTYPSLMFLFIGDGAEKAAVISLGLEKGLRNLLFLDPVKREEVPRYLSIVDMALIPLKKSVTFKTVIPSKIFESSAMQIPILLGVDGEARQLVERYQAGIYFEPENTSDFIGKLTHYIEHQNELKPFYQSGCRMLALDFDRKKLASAMLKVVEETV